MRLNPLTEECRGTKSCASTLQMLIIFFLFFGSNTFSQSYNFHNFSSEDGLPQSYVYSITQDVHGYLWIGTGNGLSRFNGFRFENFTTSDSLADNFVTCGITDGENLWFGHNNGSLSFYNGKKFHRVNLPKEIGSPITRFAKSTDGHIWASTYSDGLLKLSKDSGVLKRYVFKDQVIIISFNFLYHNDLLIGTNTGLLYCRLNESGEIEKISSVKEIPESKITCIIKRRNKPGFFIATENDGIFILITENNKLEVSKIIADNNAVFTRIQDVIEDCKLDLWICSFGNGLIKLTGSDQGEFVKTVPFNNANAFAPDNVKTVFEDREGNVWSGNYGKGLTQITPKTFSVIKFDNPLCGNDIFSICLSLNYSWIGTGNGLVKTDRLTGKVVKFFGKGSGLPKDTVTAIYSDDRKELWIGTGKNGVFTMDLESEKIQKFKIENGALENEITTIAGKGEQIWIGTKIGLCSVNMTNNQKKWYTINHGGIPHNFINCLFFDSKERLWVSTRSNTLAYIQNEKVFKIPLNSGSSTSTMGPITEDKDSRIWVGSNGNGVFMIKSDSITNLTVKEGLLSNFCYSIICDDHNNIWIGHKGGLSKIRISDFSMKPIQHFESITDSYQFNPNAISKDQQGKIWFGSDKGLVLYDPSMEYSKFLSPVLIVTSIRINDIEKEITDKIILSPGNYTIRIDFMGIILKDPELVTYQYKLEGFNQWSEISKSTSVTYTNLSPGNYSFILNSASGDGAITENPLRIDILIKTPVWNKWWFYPGIFLFIFTLTFIYIKRRIYRLQADKTKLEEKVMERTSEIQFQKNEIELQRDLIDEKNENITSSIRYARHIQNAVLPPLEFINKLLPDNFILSRPKDIVSGDFYWLAEKDNKIVFTVADCTGHGVPGAFMSLLGITLLNEIVNIQGITRSDAIITRLRERIIQCLQQNRKEITTTDGMDIALCVLDRKQNKIQFTGGKNDLVYIRDAELVIIKADRISVCASETCSGLFTMKEINVKKGDVFYIFSDGFQDQFGGDYDKKYLSSQFYSSLLEIHELPMLKQKEVLDIKFNEWMKNYIQTDDITVMGIRL